MKTVSTLSQAPPSRESGAHRRPVVGVGTLKPSAFRGALLQHQLRGFRLNQNEWAATNRPITQPATITQGMLSHHLLPCCAASRPRTAEIAIAAKLIGSRQFENGGTKTLPSRSTLATPSFADRVIVCGIMLQIRSQFQTFPKCRVS